MHDLAKKAPGLDRAQEADNSRLRVYSLATAAWQTRFD
jgi:hypothetical protein